MTRHIRTAVLISGHGSNLQALLDAAQAPDYPAAITLVISNKADAYGLTRAAQAGIKSLVINHKNYPTREAFDAAMDEALRAHGIELVVLAGFMRVLSDWFVTQWAGRLINIHPSLLPAYRGMDTHARVLAAGDAIHGATVHWVIPELDAGEIIIQQSLPVLPDDTVKSLQAHVHALEHIIYPQALRMVAEALLARK
jgi:phosphoribosylglycinamide formyltransferase-1